MTDDENPFASFEPSQPPAETKTENPAKGKRGRPKKSAKAKSGRPKKAKVEKAPKTTESASETIKLTVANYGRLLGLSDAAAQVLRAAYLAVNDLPKKEQRKVVDTLANLIS